jgi:rhodanese-related sulfurtransferase/Fe-S cluster assembly iron-binding protein IscA
MSAEAAPPPAQSPDAVIVFAAEIEATTTREMLDLCRQHGPTPLVIDATTDPLFADHARDARTRDHFPLLCVRGALVGGLAVVRHLAAEGRLSVLLIGELAKVPTLAVSQTAAAVLGRELGDPQQHIRIVITPNFEHQVSVDMVRPGDVELTVGGVAIILDAQSAGRADGLAIDWVDGDVKGLRIDNPNRPMPVRVVDGSWLDSAGAAIRPVIIDARTAAEYRSFHLEGARLLDAELIDSLETLAHHTPLLFYCNGGIRSQRAATRFHEQGFTEVYCMREDPSVCRTKPR